MRAKYKLSCAMASVIVAVSVFADTQDALSHNGHSPVLHDFETEAPNKSHKIIDFQKFDSLCKLHFNTFSWFCDDCQKNICCYCKPTHKNHNLVDLIEIDFTEELKTN